MNDFLKTYVMVTLALAGGTAFAAQPAAAQPPRAAVEVDAWMARRAELMVQMRGLEGELDRAWFDPTNTSPAIEAFRAKLRELEEALAKTRENLKKQVLELPANREKQAKADAVKTEINALTDKINVYLQEHGQAGEMHKVQKRTASRP